MLCRTYTEIASGKTTHDLISCYAKDAKRKIEGDKKIKHKHITDDVSCVSCIHSNVSRALRVKMPIKPKKTVVPAPPQPAIETVTDVMPPMNLPQTTFVIGEPPTRSKKKAATKTTTAIQPSHKQKRSSPSITESDELMASTQTCPPNLSAKTAPSRQKRRQMIIQQQTQNKSIVSTIKTTAALNQDAEQSNITVLRLSELRKFRKYHDSLRGRMHF